MNNRSMEKIGNGGNNIVYETKKNSENGLILKFNFHSISMLINSILGKIDDRNLLVIKNMIDKKDKSILNVLDEVEDKILVNKIINFYNNKESENLDDIMKNVKEYFLANNHILASYKEDIGNEVENYRQLSEFFKKENLLNIKFFNIDSSYFGNISNTDDTTSIINNLTHIKGLENFTSEDLEKLKTYILDKNIEIPIIIQEKFDFKNKENVFAFNSELPIYNNFKNILTEDLKKKDYTDTINELSKSIKENKIYDLIAQDPLSKDAICDFLKRVIDYTSRTHQLIDFFGGDNIFFYKENNVYKYKLVDPIMEMTNYSNNPNFKNNTFEDFLEKNKEDIRHFYVYIKTINNLAKDLGIEERLNPVDYFGTNINGVEIEINNFINK